MPATDELYVPCPRCRGSRSISVCTRPGDGWRPSLWEYVTCPLCHGSAEADAELAAEWTAAQMEDEDA